MWEGVAEAKVRRARQTRVAVCGKGVRSHGGLGLASKRCPCAVLCTKRHTYTRCLCTTRRSYAIVQRSSIERCSGSVRLRWSITDGRRQKRCHPFHLYLAKFRNIVAKTPISSRGCTMSRNKHRGWSFPFVPPGKQNLLMLVGC